MTIEAMMKSDEQELWSGEKSESVTFNEFFFNPILPFTTFFGIIFLWIVCRWGIGNVLSSGGFFIFLLFFLVYMLPFWIFLGIAVAAKISARNTRYALTTRGIYIQTGKAGREQTKFYAYGDLSGATIKQGKYDVKYHVGDVVCSFKTPVMISDNTSGVFQTSFTLNNFMGYAEVARLINEQIAQCRTQAAQEPDPTTELFDECATPLNLNRDSEGYLRSAAEQTALLKNLPDESVSALQAELFGTDAEQQGAFADPTVNPLPELPEPPQDNEQGQLMQRGL